MSKYLGPPRVVAGSVIFFMALILFACNPFDTLNSEGTSDDPRILLEDARLALMRGDVEASKDYLERAHALAPDDVEIRIELSAALFRVAGIDILLAREMGNHIRGMELPSGGTTEPSPATFSPGPGDACNFTGTAFPFDLSSTDAFPILAARRDVIGTAHALLLDIEIRDADLDLQVRGRGLLTRSVAGMAMSLLRLQDDIDAFFVDLYRLTDDSLGACAPNQELLDSFEERLRCERLPSLQARTDDLVARIELLAAGSGSLTEAVVQAIEEANERLAEHADVVCIA